MAIEELKIQLAKEAYLRLVFESKDMESYEDLVKMAETAIGLSGVFVDTYNKIHSTKISPSFFKKAVNGQIKG